MHVKFRHISQIQKCELSIIFIYFNSEIYELYEMLYSFKLRCTSNLDISLKFKNVNSA